jgi:2-polyprenyl-6-methoxyphenol hydroxylase-like FAD-dependent oxidoreductase
MRVAIVGAGIGGMTAALFLRRAGVGAVVHEQAPEFGDGRKLVPWQVNEGSLQLRRTYSDSSSTLP